MQIPAVQLLNCFPILNRVAASVKVGGAAYKLLKLLRVLKAEFDTIDAARLAIYQKYGDLNEAGTEYTLREETKGEAEEALKELAAQTVEVAANPLPLSMLKDIPISVEEMGIIEPLVVDDVA